ncbi:MAG: bifunctional diguanylate cyclase/phosphodiesterase [Desulfovibrio sp.]|nr:bifunctional diguanylate cyclase/phosphodiesterase [Desulfovibrio sp.]
MRIRRLLFLFLFLALLFAGLSYLVSSSIVLRGVDGIERHQAVQSMDHMRERLALAEGQVAWQAQTISSSPSLYADVRTKNLGALSDKISDEYVESLQISGIAIFDTNKRLLFSAENRNSFFSEAQAEQIHEVAKNAAARVLLRNAAAGGLVSIEGTPYFLAAERIVEGRRGKSTVGVLVMVKTLPREFRAGGETSSFLRFSVFPKGSYFAVPAEKDENTGYKIVETPGEIFVYALEKDIFGADACCMELRGDRFLTAFGSQISWKNFFFMLMIALSLLALAIYLIHKAELSVMRREIEYRTSHDGMTGLFNKTYSQSYLEELLTEARKNGEYVGVVFINMDRFCGVNDRFGYEAGDQLIREAGSRLSAIRGMALLSRFEGDKFLLIDRSRNKDAFYHCAQTASEALCESFRINGHEIYITTSIGIAMFPSDGENALDVLRRSEMAMHHAQKIGCGQIKTFSLSMEEDAAHRVSLLADLTKDLDEEKLTVFYQPKVDVDRKCVMGCEALIRWRRNGEMIPPPSFIPLAEETGLVTRIDMFVLRTACRQISAWTALGIDNVRVAVNMSAKSIQGPTFVERVQQIINEENVQADRVELEITETSLMQDLDVASKSIAVLHSKGIHVSLDDFGTGYSSLRYLNAMPITCLKVDKSFVDGLLASVQGNSHALVRGTLALARGLGKDIVAEGVEFDEQLAFLMKHNCSIIQGYIFSRALSSEDCTEFLLHEREHIDPVLARMTGPGAS